MDAHEKQGAVLRVLAGEEAARVAEDLGVTRPAVLNWRRAWSEEGAAAFMGDIAERTPGAAGALPDDPEELKRMVRELRMENDLMREVVELVKKRPRRRPLLADEPGEGGAHRRAQGDVFLELFDI